MGCCQGSDFKSRYGEFIDKMPMSGYERSYMRERYIRLVVSAETSYERIRAVYWFLTTLITVAGVLITAFISLGRLGMIGDTAAGGLFWAAWSLSIALTIANKFIHAFGVYKKYTLGLATVEKLRSEGWMFAAGIGRYNRDDFAERFKKFCSRVEKLRLRSVENLPEFENADAARDMIAAGTSAVPTQSHVDIGIIPPLESDDHIIIGGGFLRDNIANDVNAESI